MKSPPEGAGGDVSAVCEGDLTVLEVDLRERRCSGCRGAARMQDATAAVVEDDLPPVKELLAHYIAHGIGRKKPHELLAERRIGVLAEDDLLTGLISLMDALVQIEHCSATIAADRICKDIPCHAFIR